MKSGSCKTLGLIGTGAGGLELIRKEVVEPFVTKGWRVAVTLTPTAAQWLHGTGETEEIERITALPVRVTARIPGEPSPHPRIDCYAVVPASANSVAKMALGIADNQALTTICEAIGTIGIPVIVFPRINSAHARQPAWQSHIASLRRAGVRLVYGEDVWPLHEPRSAPGRDLPWQVVRDTIQASLTR